MIGGILFLTLVSKDKMNRLTRRKIIALKEEIEGFYSSSAPVLPLVISGDPTFFRRARTCRKFLNSMGLMRAISPSWARC